MVQDKETSTSKEKTKWTMLLGVGKLLITFLIVSYIYRTFENEQKGIRDIGIEFRQILQSGHPFILIAMVLLVPVNWALESLKWRRLASKVVPISFWDAFRGTLTGLAVGVAAPAQLGDTIGRVAALKSENRLEAIGAAVVSNGIQFYVSVIFGAIGWAALQNNLEMNPFGKRLLTVLLLVLVVSGWLVVIFRHNLMNWKSTNYYFNKIHDYLHIIGDYTTYDLAISTLFGTLRYLVFLSQFVLALSLFQFPLTLFELACCVTLIFLAKTLIPAVNILGDLGLREFTALFVFKQYDLPAEQIITATFLIWILNVLGPILIGIFLVWKYKWQNLLR